jgi:hypothetical protein
MIRRIARACGDRFQVYGQRAGRKVYVVTFDSKREAVSAERRHVVTQEQVAAGELAAEHDTKRTLAQAVSEWLESLGKAGSRSHAGYSERMRMYILPTLGAVPITRVAKSNAMRWRDDQATRLAPATVNGSLICLSSAFSYFVDRQWLEVNPCHGVKHVESQERVYTWIQTK